MKIACTKCRTLIQDVEMIQDPNSGTITITTRCHGDTDSMTLTQEWMQSNQDFVRAIQSGIMGWAFQEAPKEEA